MFDHECVYCGGTATEVEHIKPYSKFKDNSDQNLVAACVHCNATAGARVFKSFEEKKDYILKRRTEKLEKKPVGRNRKDTDGIDDSIYPFGFSSVVRPEWHVWVYGGGKNPQLSGSRRRKKQG
jgi:hypothetical protein